ncbi:GNAT family N-acetyltransferase [Chromobacterium haemolyticum]|uniref:GNAT family N-acetyltransferase n=1 Tax=Chromobacterium haemolyticum TaxID=394935 RepID=UPI00031942EF|nr:GNAT family N-acetyltransferase [Chromobacterium haemolyticum]
MHIEAADQKHLPAYRPFFLACHEEGLDYYRRAGSDPDAWLGQLLQHAEGRALREGWVPCRTWFLINGRTEIIGAIRQRLADSALIVERIGHIAFEVLPAWRGHGYGRVLLQYVQTLGEKPAHGNWVLVCPADRPAAVRTVEACGGQLLETMENGGRAFRRYSLTALAAWDDMAEGLI